MKASYRLTLFCALLIGCFASARAQLGVYGELAVAGFDFRYIEGSEVSNTLCGSSSAPCPHNAATAGITGGVFFDIPSRSIFKAGIDLRGTFGGGSTGGETGIVSARVSMVPRQRRVRPYLQGGIGTANAHTNSVEPCNCFYTTHFTYGPPSYTASNGFVSYGGGLDLRLTRGFDVRIIDVSLYHVSCQPSGTTLCVRAGGFGSGLVYRFPTWWARPPG